MGSTIFGFVLGIGMAWCFWQAGGWVAGNLAPADHFAAPIFLWFIRAIGLVPLAMSLFFGCELLAIPFSWPFHWDGQIDRGDKWSNQAEAECIRQTGKGFTKPKEKE